MTEEEILLAAHRAEFLEECTLTQKMTAEEAAECLTDFETEALARAANSQSGSEQA